jgi:hypothetical protein
MADWNKKSEGKTNSALPIDGAFSNVSGKKAVAGDSELPEGGPPPNGPSIYDVLNALYQKIEDYGGYSKVWSALEARFNISRKQGSAGKLTKDTFRQQVRRLITDRTESAEKMVLGPRSNILLLLYLFEILGIKDISGLISGGFRETNANAVILETYQNTEDIKLMISGLNKALEISGKKKTRFTEMKVCSDSQVFFQRINSILNEGNDPSTFLFNTGMGKNTQNQLWLSALNYVPEKYRLPVLVFNMLNDYREYFAKDILLHDYTKNAFATIYFDWNDFSLHDAQWWIAFYLHTLYFHTIINKKFLAVVCKKPGGFLSDTKLELDSKTMAAGLREELKNAGKLLPNDNPGQFLFDKTNELYRLLSDIIRSSENIEYDGNSAVDYVKNILKDWTDTFFDIYFKSTTERIDNLTLYLIKHTGIGGTK